MRAFFLYNYFMPQKKNSLIISFAKNLIYLLVLPLYLIYKIARLQKNRTSRFSFKILLVQITGLIFAVFFILPLWTSMYIGSTIYIANKLGYIEETGNIPGTGSMYPTFPKGSKKNPKEQYDEIVGTYKAIPYPNGLEVFGKRYFGYEIQRGDIVTFYNQKTAEVSEKTYGVKTGFLKRVIALSGDTIEIRDGIVYLNNNPLQEPYIASARSTFGGNFLPDCKTIFVPIGFAFVMGDNRKGSGDSRHELGFINLNDVDHVIPMQKQIGVLDKNYRDITKDLEESSKIKLDKEHYIELLNQERVKLGVKPLKYQSKLEQSAFLRGKVILKYDDFSFEATRSGYTMEKAIDEIGYSNITWGEAPSRGYYEADELVENQIEFADSKNFLLNKDFQEIGIAEVEGERNGCPTQIIVQHFAGYIPPNYKKEDIESWKNVLTKLKEIQPGWRDLETFSDFYQENRTDADRLNQIISERIANIEAITQRMEANQWLNEVEKRNAENDINLHNEQEEISKRLYEKISQGQESNP